MTSKMAERLDEALARQAVQEPLSDILADFPDEADVLRPFLNTAALLDTLQPVKLPDEAALAADRAIFMAHVANLPPSPASPAPGGRLKAWIAQHLPAAPRIFPQKTLKPMTGILLKAALVLSLILGVFGGTAALTSASLPGSPLYPLKINMEQARLAMAGRPSEQAALHLAYTQERVEEIAQLARVGTPAEDSLETQLRYHWQRTLQLAALAPDEAMVDLLAQADRQVKQQQELLEVSGGGAENETLAQVAALVAFGLEEPQAFRRMGGELTGELPHGMQGGGTGAPTGPEQEDRTGSGAGGPKGPGSGKPAGQATDNGSGPGPSEPQERRGSGDTGSESGRGGYRPGPGRPQDPVTDDYKAPAESPGEGIPTGPCEGTDPGCDNPEAAGSGGPQDPGSDECETPGEWCGEPNGPGNGEPASPGAGESPGAGDPNSPAAGNPGGPADGNGSEDGSSSGDGSGNTGQDENSSGQNGEGSSQNSGGSGADSGQNGEDNGDESGNGSGDGSGNGDQNGNDNDGGDSGGSSSGGGGNR